MRRSIPLAAATLAVALLAPACGGGTAGGDDDDDAVADAAADGDPGDTTAPELRNVRVSLAGGVDVTFGLNTGDASIVLPEPVTAEVTVLVQDDTSADEDVLVEALDADGAVRAPDGVEWDGTQWRLVVEVAPGEELRVRATDEAGNQITGEHALVIPGLAAAVSDDWELHVHDESQAVIDTWSSTLSDDGAWNETRQAAGYARGGTWSIEDGALMFDERTHDDGMGDADADEATVEIREVGPFYVDDVYLSAVPYLRTAGDAGVEGTWTRRTERHLPGAGGTLYLAAEVTDTRVIAGDGAWTRSVETVSYDEKGAVTGTQTTETAGTWRIELADDYTQPYGDFFVSTTTEVDGAPLDPPSEVYLRHAVRMGRLLLAPRIRAP